MWEKLISQAYSNILLYEVDLNPYPYDFHGFFYDLITCLHLFIFRPFTTFLTVFYVSNYII